MAVAIKDAIKAAIPDPRNTKNSDVQAAYEISRLIRNAFAHSPFNPVWSIDPYCRNRVFELKRIVSLDTKDLHGIPFNWRHYGGPLAMLRLCRHVRYEILKDQERPRKAIPTPKDIYYQQGNLILEQVRESDEKE
jgi:hypothetical protein